MASKKITQKENTIDKKKLLKAIIEQLQTALLGLKEHFGEKRFEKRVTKAAEILVHGIEITPAKNVITAKKKIAKKKSKD